MNTPNVTMNSTNAHNLLPARFLIGGQRYADAFITAENAEIELYRQYEGATTPGFIQFAIAVTIGAGNNGHISPKDAMEMIDYLCGLLVA